MTRTSLCIIAALAMAPACGSRRIAGYLDELEECSSCSSGTAEAGTTHDATSSDASTSGGGGETTTANPDSTGTAETSTSTTEATATTESSTGEPLAACGNGKLEAFGPVPEECDDGNLDPNDGCSETCALDRRAFVTSIVYQAGEVESLYIADALCANHAAHQGFPEPLTYRAWLSDSTTDARDRFKRGRGRLVMVNGAVLAQSWSTLLAGALENPFGVTEKGETYHGRVWTGTRPDGTAVPGAEHCGDWSTNSFLKTGHYGYSDRTTPEWTLSASDDNPSGCPFSYALYCLQSL